MTPNGSLVQNLSRSANCWSVVRIHIGSGGASTDLTYACEPADSLHISMTWASTSVRDIVFGAPDSTPA